MTYRAPRRKWYHWVVLATCLGPLAAGCDRCGPQAGPVGPRLVEDGAATGDQACPHRLLPLVRGGQWTYALGPADAPARSSTATLQVISVEQRGEGRLARIRRTVGSSVTTVEAGCGSAGASFLALFVPLGPPLPARLGYAPALTDQEGALLPPPARLRPGAEWSYGVVARTEGPGGHDLTMDSQWNVKGRYLGRQVVTVPAGRYEATQVQLQVTGHHRPPEQKQVILTEALMDPPTMVFTYSLAPGAGVVLIEGEPPPGRPHLRPRWALTALTGPSAP